MNIRNVTFILMLGLLILFSMCKKDTASPPPNTGGNGGNGGNGSNNNGLRFVSFSPESGAIGDTVNINFTGYANNISVNFGNTPARVLSFNTTTTNNVQSTVIRVLVPDMPDTTTKIKVKVDTVLFTSEKSFTRTNIPQFSGFSPANGFIGDTITITGTFYERYTPDVRFGNIRASVISNDNKTMKIVVPNDIDNATPAITVVDGQTMTSTTLFHLKAPVIDSITPKTAYIGQTVRIIGKGFLGPFSSTYNNVYLDNSLVYNNAESNTSIAINTKNASLGSHTIAVEVAGLKTVAKDPLSLIAPVPPVITSILEDTVTNGTTIEIMGNHLLSPAPEMPATVTTVDQDGNIRNFRIQYNADNEIIAWVPSLSKTGQYKITVTVLSSSVTYSKPLTYLSY
ncbi:hypothetical protein A4D02_28425 [Niastella koreensis]|uniref:IPT/TIG domain-containing protein n=2 Tax=Niastella koreensis TaxID=354356 RepID=G8T8K2_NIAKG|nr:IPT/TIG domain-containing protein [Niastella koreensis]AEW00174.1 hypothetical protein Niako_3888 [Niastella koreensis GR20-10]OQP49522.1 hypothetical protein A4D02_28425 [Niastella koreensis]